VLKWTAGVPVERIAAIAASMPDDRQEMDFPQASRDKQVHHEWQ